jgi:GAF domain-containing protein
MMDLPDTPGERISGWDDLLLDEQGIDDALGMALTLSRRSIAGDPAVSLTVRPLNGRGPSTRGATDELARRLDEWQYEHGEGPCVASDREHAVCIVPDLTEDESFPDFAETALAEGVQGVASFPLLVRETSIGSLNVFVRSPDEIDEDTVSIGQQLAAMLAPTLANFLTHERTVELTGQLEEALRGRSIIERAKGMLMARLGIDADRAFELLSAQSQHENRKVRDVASTMLAEHERATGTTNGGDGTG